MRLNIVHPGAGELNYEIRGIVEFAEKLAATGIDIIWENIGDPVAKGEEIPIWIREIVSQEALNNSSSFGYSPTKGLQAAREFIADNRSQQGVELPADNIMFFNGLGDAINKIYTWLNPEARVLGPNPAYPTHSIIEAAHGHGPHLTYKLDPHNAWLPDIEDIRRKVAANSEVAAILIINPDNPTGAVYPRELLNELVELAREYKLFLIADEIYANLTHDQSSFVSLGGLADGVPTLIMRGLSKEVPWPGSRCGWLEFYNLDADPDFALYVRSIEEAKMTEVCSTTLPQTVLPAILGDARYQPHLDRRRAKYARRAAEAFKVLDGTNNLKTVLPKGAFYLPVTFNEAYVQAPLPVTAANPQAQSLLKKELADIPENDFDKRFCYTLLANTGVCTVPMTTGFNSALQGFRMTLLEEDDAKFKATLQAIKDFVDVDQPTAS